MPGFMRRGLERIEAWILAPNQSNRRKVADLTFGSWERPWAGGFPLQPLRQLILAEQEERAGRFLLDAIQMLRIPVPEGLATMRREVQAWALGIEDPVLARVEGRTRERRRLSRSDPAFDEPKDNE